MDLQVIFNRENKSRKIMWKEKLQVEVGEWIVFLSFFFLDICVPARGKKKKITDLEINA